MTTRGGERSGGGGVPIRLGGRGSPGGGPRWGPPMLHIDFKKRLVTCQPGPASQLAKGYASLFQKTLRKGIYFCFLYVLDIGGKKGSFFGRMSALKEKKGYFVKKYSLKKGYFLVL